MDDVAEAKADGTTIRVEKPGIAVWTGHPTSETAWFFWNDGEITVTRPDGPMRRRMFEVASTLGARVEGDGGELYDASGEAVDDDDADERPDTSKGFLGRLFGRG